MMVPTNGECSDLLFQIVSINAEKYNRLSPQERIILDERIDGLLQQVLFNENHVPKEKWLDETHITDLNVVRKLASQAKEKHLCSKKTEETMNAIALKAREMGITYRTSVKDFTIYTRGGEEGVNIGILARNSPFFRAMVEHRTREAKEGAAKLDISRKTLQFLMHQLHEPTNEELILPDDDTLVFEFTACVLSYQFDGLFKKLDQPLSRYLETHQAKVFMEAPAWIKLFQSEISNPIPAKWLYDLTLLILKNFKVTPRPSEIPGLITIPERHALTFFDKKHSELLQELPIIIEIANLDDLDKFTGTMKLARLELPLTIRLLCKIAMNPGQKSSLLEAAEKSKIELTIVEDFVPHRTVFYGKEMLETYYGKVEEIPLPHGIAQLLYKDVSYPMPDGKMFYTGKIIKDFFMLVQIPSTIDGVPVTLNRLRDMAAHPKTGINAATYKPIEAGIIEPYVDKQVDRSKWVLVSKGPMVNFGALNASNKLDDVLKKLPGIEPPDLLTAHMALLIHYNHTGHFLCGKGTYMLCKEDDAENNSIYNPVIGNFDINGLEVSDTHPDHTYVQSHGKLFMGGVYEVG